jgi:hypothetical protein
MASRDIENRHRREVASRLATHNRPEPRGKDLAGRPKADGRPRGCGRTGFMYDHDGGDDGRPTTGRPHQKAPASASRGWRIKRGDGGVSATRRCLPRRSALSSPSPSTLSSIYRPRHPSPAPVSVGRHDWPLAAPSKRTARSPGWFPVFLSCLGTCVIEIGAES